ncbi:MAG TPA: HAD hydrolase-like protein [Candidatus Sulfotelmatobacter sp.]|nr:HAD hydrolase-like protein [Candidatus Sulfotelmatobacter sp.]
MATFIFDFDGTIADSRDYIINFIAKEAGKFPLDSPAQHELYGKSVVGIARHLGLKWYQLPGLLVKGRKSMGQMVKHIKPFPGMLEVMKKIKHEGHEIIVVSSNSVENVRKFLHHNKMDNLVLAVYGGVEIFGKAPVFREILNEFNLDAAQVVCIGDELRDIEAAQSVDLKQVAVTWGFASVEQIKELKPSWVVNEPKELLQVLEEF